MTWDKVIVLIIVWALLMAVALMFVSVGRIGDE